MIAMINSGRIKRPCNQPGCSELVENGKCDVHRASAEAQRLEVDRRRGTARNRGYDSNWERFRIWFLRRHPICADGPHLATEVHHVKKLVTHPELKLVESNCLGLCKADHSKRTARGE